MFKGKGKSKGPRGGLAVLLGLAATLLVAIGHRAGMDRWLELGALDARFRWLSTAPPADEIVNVDIDDRSLEEQGRWPWPREQLAGIVETLEQCGARELALDIILPEPQKVRYEAVAGFATLEDTRLPPVPVFDDMVLAETLGSHDNVFLPMHVDLRPSPPGKLEAAVQRVVAARPGASLEEVTAEVQGDPARGAARAAAPDVLARAYLRARALAEMPRFGVAPERASGCPLIEGGLLPPLVTFAAALQHTGFVTFDPDGDGTVRRIPLLARYDGRIYPQFALSIAEAELERRTGQACDLAADAGGVILSCGGEVRRIPVDGQGYMLINWERGGPKSGRHLPAGEVGEMWQTRKRLENLDELRRILCKELLGLCEASRTDELADAYWALSFQLYADLDRLRAERLRRMGERKEALLFDPSNVPSRESVQTRPEQPLTEAQIDRAHAMFIAELADANHLDLFLGRPTVAAAATRPALEQAFRSARMKARSLLATVTGLGEFARRGRSLMESEMARLRQAVSGKICLVGSTATGAADFVPTPMEKRMPGVMVHANIVNTILSGRFVRPAGEAADLGAILLCGLAVSVVTARRPVWQSAPITGLLAGAYAAGAALAVFHLWDIWLAMVAPLVAMLLAFLVVTAYRQITEERAKRQIRGMFASTLSPELVDRLTEDPSLLKLGGERRPLSCFFTDLQGFTPLAEKLGEQVTGRLLNRYFDRMTEIIRNRQGGTMNKFMGDGIFAFFGAPVSQDDHAARAVRAAVDYVRELKALNPRLAEELREPVNLFCRVGIATGEAMVGNYGSTDKFDYTAIGDTVNLASRLEGANKFFGTHVLVDETTWKQAGADRIVARCLGRVRVVGKNEAVTVWNVMGWRDDLAPEVAEAAAGFTRAVELYVRREFVAAAGLLEKYLAVVPDDKAAETYVDLCRNAVPAPGDEWDGVLRLTQK